MESKVINAKSKDEAIEKLLQVVDADRESIKITIQKEPSKGFLGFGSKDGVYELSYELVTKSVSKEVVDEIANNEVVSDVNVDNDDIEGSVDTSEALVEGVDNNEEDEVYSQANTEEEMRVAENFIRELLKNADVNAEVDVTLEDDLIKIKIKGDDASCLIGRRGDTLDSIQFLVGLALNKVNKNSRTRVFVDIENYRSKREESLKRYCYKAAREVARTRRTKKLDYMNPYERRIIHSALQNDRYVITYSEGTDPYRRVVIEYKK